MLVTLALVIFLAAITVFFSEEFIRAFKKLFAIKGTKLFLPLFAASWLIYTFDFWFLWTFFYVREILNGILAFLIDIMPFQQGKQSVALIILLTVLSVVPVIIIDVLNRRKSFKGFRYPYLTSTLVWIVSVIMLIIL